MVLASEVLLYWAVIAMEETPVSWSMRVTVKSSSDEDFFAVRPVIFHSEIPG